MRNLVLLSALVVGCGGKDSVPADDAGGVDAGVLDAGPADAGSADAGACLFAPAAFDGGFTEGQSGATAFFLFRHPAPRGLVVALHGSNGSATAVAQNKVEWQSFFAAAAARGYSLLVPESEQRDPPRHWDNAANAQNPDTARLASLLDDARKTGALPAGSPVFLIGISQGGGVAPIFGAVLASRGYPVRAVAVHSAGGSAVFQNAAYTLPTTFVAMAQDTLVPPSETISAAASLQARGIDAEVFVKPAERLCETRFTRVPGLDPAMSREIFSGLVDAGSVAADGTVLAGGSDRDQTSSLRGVPAAYASFTRRIDEQLQVVAARHAFCGDRNQATLAFFDAHR